MPVVTGDIVCPAPPIEVWRLVHDPARLNEWMADTERVEPGEDGTVTRYLHGWPEYPMPTRVDCVSEGGRVVVSCLVSDIDIVVSLAAHPDGCAVTLEVRIPDVEAARAETMRSIAEASLAKLAERAARGVALG